ncbi:dihydrodipicolinate synthase family protein [Bacteroidota bacterium]
MISLKGIIPPLPTSFHVNEELYPEMIRENIEHLMQFELSGILVLGSNGEFVMLTENEKEQVFAIVREALPYGKLMIAGCGGQSTRETIRLTRLAAKHGADAALVLNPFYYKGLMTDDVLVGHYHAVADGSPIPVIIYNMPANSGIDMGEKVLVRIAEHKNIIGLKDSGGDIKKMTQVVKHTADDFGLLAGSAGFLLPALEIGATGGILGLANVLPQKCLDIWNTFSNGQLDVARTIQQSVIDLNLAVTRKWGIPAMKAAMDEMGLYGGPARGPLPALDPEKKEELINLLSPLK